ncbi:FAS1 domain-containing protein [Histoplasma ohiense]|nr:FAS1 domain-containing protein [Histoplasma ohiense (nom. inval.)]
MKYRLLFLILSISFSVSAVRVHLENFVSRRRLLPRNLQIPTCLEAIPNSFTLLLPPQDQIVMGDNNDRPQGEGNDPDEKVQSLLYISDILSKTREVNIFSSLTRDIEAVSTRFNNGTESSIVLAPLNSAIHGLPRKPWEDPADYRDFGEAAYTSKEGEARAEKNLKHFVEAHIVPMCPWPSQETVKTVGGRAIYWKKEDDGKVYIYPDKIEVLKIMTQASNGEVWILNRVINYH